MVQNWSHTCVVHWCHYDTIYMGSTPSKCNYCVGCLVVFEGKKVVSRSLSKGFSFEEFHSLKKSLAMSLVVEIKCLPPCTHTEPHSIIHEGWCVKESGTALFGKTNWRRRWFRLIQTKRDILLQYYRSVAKSMVSYCIAYYALLGYVCTCTCICLCTYIYMYLYISANLAPRPLPVINVQEVAWGRGYISVM